MQTHAQRIRAERVASHAIMDRLDSPRAVAERLFAIQAQDLPAALWAIGSRTASSTRDEVVAHLDSGVFVRSWPMRSTLHIVPAEDLGWMLELTSAREERRSALQRSRLDIDDRVLGRAGEIAEASLGGGRSLSRAGLHEVWNQNRITTDGQRGYHLIVALALRGVLCWGPFGSQGQDLVLNREWIPASRRRSLDGDEALGEWLLRYLAGHAPATLADFVWWTGLTLGHARRAVGAVHDHLESFEDGGEQFWRLRDSPKPPAATGVVALAPFDEYFLGYRDRSRVCDPQHAPAVIPGGNGVFQPIVVARGHVAGTWKRTGPKGSPTISLATFDTFSARDRRAFTRDIHRWADFYGVTASLEETR